MKQQNYIHPRLPQIIRASTTRPQWKDIQSKASLLPINSSRTEAASPADIQHGNRPHQRSKSYYLPKLILILLLLSGTGNTALAQSCPPQISYIKIVGVDQHDPEKVIPGTSVQTDLLDMETGVIGADGMKSGVQRFRRTAAFPYIPFFLSIKGVQYTRPSGALAGAMPEDPRWYPCWQVQKAPYPDRTMIPSPLVDYPSSWLGQYPLRDFYEPFEVASATCRLVEGGVSTLRSDPLTGELVARANAASQGNASVFIEFVYFDEAWLPGRIAVVRIPNEFLNGTDVELRANPLGPPPNWATHYGARLTDENGEPLLNCSPYGLALLPLKPAYFLPSPGCDYEQTVTQGTPIISLISAADGRQPVRYRWFKDGSPIAGANTSVLEILNVQEADEGTYWVEAWNPDGPSSDCEIRLKVIVPPQVTSLTAWSPPHPLDPAPACGDHSSFEGHSVTFKVEATGTPPLRYQWRKNFGNIFDDYRISGANSNELAIKWLIFGDSGDYHVVVSNEAGEVSSQRIRLCSLHLTFGPGFIENPAIKSPLGQPIKVGDDVTLGAKVWGSFPLAAQWFKNGQPFRSATVLTGNATNNVTLTISNAQTNDSGYYFLSLSNINGFVVSSNVVVVDVLAEPKVTSLMPIMQTGWMGDSVRFEVTATGSRLGYQWRKAGNALSNSTKITGVNTDTLTVANLHATDAGSYDVVVSNAVGSATSESATLTVLTTVAISQHPVSKSVAAGQGVFFSVSASGTPPLAYRWYKNGDPLNSGGRFFGTATDTLQIANVQAGDAGEYHVVITGVAGNQRPSNPATLSVVLPPTITQQPEALTVAVGQMAHFEVKATGTPPLSYHWRRNGVLLRNGAGIEGVNSTRLTLVAAQISDAGLYDVTVSNGSGSQRSLPARLVVEDPLAPRLITPLLATATSELSSHRRLATNAVNGIRADPNFWQSVGVGQGFGEDRNPAITFDFLAVHRVDHLNLWNTSDPLSGVVRMAIASSVDGVVFDNTAREIVVNPSGGPVRLFLGGLSARFVRFTILENTAGVVFPVVGIPSAWSLVGIEEVEFWGWSLGLNPNPTILTEHPQSLTLDAGQNARFTVNAAGTPPFIYQWFKNGFLLLNGDGVFGANTNVLALSEIEMEDAGVYHVVVSAEGGSATSLPATLKVLDPLVPTLVAGITASATSELVSHGRLAANTLNGVYLDGYFWQSVGVGAGSDEDRAPAITFDLKAEHRLDHLLIWNGHEAGSDIRRLTVAVSDDGIAFQPMPGEFTLVFNSATTPQTLRLEGVSARFVRLNILENGYGVTFPIVGAPSGGSQVAIDEVEFYGWQASGPPEGRPTIRQHPLASSRPAGQTAEFVVVATGTPPLAYEWRKNGNPLSDGSNVSGADTATLKLTNVQAADVGSYDVVVSNAGGSTPPSMAATLVVEPVTIMRQPGNLIVSAGQTARFTVTATGTDLLTYQWRKGGEALSDVGNISGATTATLTLAHVQPGDAGSYDVVIRNGADSTTSIGVSLWVPDPQLYRELLLHLPFNGNAQDASGNERHGQAVGATLTSDRFGEDNSAFAFSGSSVVSVINLDPDDHATGFSFGCWLKSSNGGGSPAYWIHDAGWGSTYIILGLPSSMSFRLGSGNPATSYGVNGLNLALNQWHHVFVTHDASFDRLYVNGQMVFESASQPLQGNVSTLYLGTDGFRGSIDEFAVFGRGLEPDEVLAIYHVGIAPTVTVDPAITGQPGNSTVVAGQAAQFTVEATGAAPLTYQWRKDGFSLADGGLISGATNSLLTLSSAQLADAGAYDVVVSNNSGSVTSQVAMLIVTLPTTNRVVLVTSTNRELLLQFSGIPTSTWWVLRAPTLPGPWSSIGAVTLAENGSGSFVDTNPPSPQAFYQFSAAQSLAPSIITHPQSQTSLTGTTANLSVAATGTAPLIYQWRRNGIALNEGGSISGTGTSALFLTNVQPTDAGDFDAVVTNNFGSVTSQVAILTVVTQVTLTRISTVTATATSELSSFSRLAAYLTDGTFNPDGTLAGGGGVWESAGIGFSTPEPDDRAPMIMFDLGRDYTVGRIGLWNFPEAQVAIKRLVLESSPDGVNFSAVSEIADINQAGETIVETLLLGVRHLRFRILENWGGTIYPVAEGDPVNGFHGFAGLVEVAFYGQ